MQCRLTVGSEGDDCLLSKDTSQSDPQNEKRNLLGQSNETALGIEDFILIQKDIGPALFRSCL